MKKETTVALIRTERVSPRALAVAARLRTCFSGQNIFFVVNSHRGESEAHNDEYNCIYLNDFVRQCKEDNELTYLPKDWAWRFGDFSLYAAAKRLPSFERFWMFEPDVEFNKFDISEMFDLGHDVDFAALRYQEAPEKWYHYSNAVAHFPNVFQCLFPIVFSSRKAVEIAFRERKKYLSSDRGDDNMYANDESFYASSVGCHGLKGLNLATHAPEAFAHAFFTSSKMIPSRALLDFPTGILHPVVSDDEMLSKVESRIRKNFNKGVVDHYAFVFSRYFSQKECGWLEELVFKIKSTRGVDW